MQIIYSFDSAALRFANFVLNGCGTVLTPVFKFITYLGNYGLIFIVAAAVLCLFRNTRLIGLTAICALFIGFLFTNVALKHIVARNRPFVNENSPYYNYWLKAGALKESGYSFPSGHTTSAAAFSIAVFLCAKKRAAAFVLLAPLIMGFTRIYFGVHYASDVVGGLLVGAVAALIATIIVNRVFPHVLMRFSSKKS